jgi:hypothetical protein
MKTLHALLVLATAGLLACSGADFGTGAGDDDTGTDATDSSVTPDTTDSTTPPPDGDDSAIPSDTADSTVPVDAPDVTPSDVVLESGDTCVLNACGGCKTLTGTKGDACGTCGGKLVCDGTDALKCDGSKPKNACGGCTTLTPALATACGACGSGVTVCNTADTTGETTKCSDPVTTPAPGTACGTCKTLKYACATDKLSTVCPGDDANACGGCGTLVGPPSTACGTKCGIYVCSTDKSSDSCVDATPKLGDPCSICGTVAYTCLVPGKTTCTKTDDRTTGVDSSTSTGVASTPNYFNNVNTVAFTYKTRRIGSIFQLDLAIQKQDWVGSGLAGTITVKIYKGVPGSGTLLATTTIDPALVSLSTFTSVPAIFGTPTADQPSGTALYFQFSSDQPRYRYYIQGGSTVPADGGFWVDTGSGTGFSGPASGFAPIFAVETNGCF